MGTDHYQAALALVYGSSGGSAPKPKRKRVSIPDAVTPNTKLRLEAAARLAFPDGSVKAATLRREAAAGHLTVYRVAGKLYTTVTTLRG